MLRNLHIIEVKSRSAAASACHVARCRRDCGGDSQPPKSVLHRAQTSHATDTAYKLTKHTLYSLPNMSQGAFQNSSVAPCKRSLTDSSSALITTTSLRYPFMPGHSADAGLEMTPATPICYSSHKLLYPFIKGNDTKL